MDILVLCMRGKTTLLRLKLADPRTLFQYRRNANRIAKFASYKHAFRNLLWFETRGVKKKRKEGKARRGEKERKEEGTGKEI